MSNLEQILKSAGRSVRLYVYGGDGYHSGGQWVSTTIPRKYPDEEIYLSEALKRINEAMSQGFEVRVTNDGDQMVFHAIGDSQIFPEAA